MRILIASATRLEIAGSLQELRKYNVDILFTGVGIAATTYALTKTLAHTKPYCIVQAGIAGSFDKNIPLGSVFAISKDEFGDLGVIEHGRWKSIFDLGFSSSNRKPFKEGVLKNPHKILLKKSGLQALPAITVNEISTNKTKIQLLKNKGAILESMEGAALHYVALMENIPFLQLRAISNYVGERDKSKWNFKTALNNLHNELLRCVKEIGGE